MRKVKNFLAQVNLSGVALSRWKAERMYSQGYRFVGKHSAIKICEWTKKCIRGCATCYKHQFYGINSHQCVQMTPVAFFCDFNCIHCWRSLNFSLPDKNFVWDSPNLIVEGCVKEHIKCLQGFKRDEEKHKILKEAEKPKHFAISLSGEPTIYPYLPEMIDLIKNKGMTAFLVTNGAHPDKVKALLNHQPTNLYVTLHAPNSKIFKKECCPMIKDGWEKLNETLSLLKDFDCNTVIRLTLSKKSNMFYPEQYAKIIEKNMPSFVEVKGYMAVGGAREKMGMDAMPAYQEIIDFAKEIEKNGSYRIIDKNKVSNVVLMKKIKKRSHEDLNPGPLD